jgi:hypothetical protein
MEWGYYCSMKPGVIHSIDCPNDLVCEHCGKTNPEPPSKINNTHVNPQIIEISDDDNAAAPPALRSIDERPIRVLPRLDPEPANVARQNAIKKTQQKDIERPHAGSIIHSFRPKQITVSSGRTIASVKKGFRLLLILFFGEQDDARLGTYANWKQIREHILIFYNIYCTNYSFLFQIGRTQAQITSDDTFTTMSDLINILSLHIPNWSELIVKNNPVEIFLASECSTKHGPTHLTPSIWNNPIETVLRHFTCNGTRDPIWTIYICLALPDPYLETPSKEVTEKTDTKKNKKSRIKKEKDMLVPVKRELESPLISHKRSFSDIDRELTEMFIKTDEHFQEHELANLTAILDDTIDQEVDHSAEEERNNMEEKEEEEEEGLDAPAGRTRFKNIRVK